ncbi:uncharacterized protein LOC123310752 [Coccinella septempunctata]|uniref:uncharacterized protein LOC123310752 n=1 Tax=Coccinella septempunctata TaxID=41139 RepID=UPI001D09762C|nr:uncharacterized protein LOC123310752 [Coccinella septempunctata]
MILEALIVLLLGCCWYWYTGSAKYRIGNFPSPPAYFLLGHAPYVNSADKVLPYVEKYLSKFDGVMKIHVGTEVLLCISNYKYVEWIISSTTMITKSFQYKFFEEWLGRALLITSGPYWRSHRKILTPAFHFKRIENLISVCQNAGNILVQQMSKNLDKGSFDVYPIISNFSLDVVCESSMATSINAQENKSEYRRSIKFLCEIILKRAFDAFYIHDLLFLLHPEYKTYKKSIENIHEFDESVIKQRRKLLENSQTNEKDEEDAENVYGEKKRTPFLDILLRARDENGYPLSDKDIRDEVDGIMFAGFETTASAVSFILYNLSVHPDVQERVYNEQKEIFSKKSTSEITYADLNDMKYLEMVIKESLRLYSPIPFVARKLVEDTHFDGKLIPKNTTVTIFLHHLHRNPEVFPEPDKFDPTRFDANSKIPNYAFLPFSAGLRNCIGQKFAMFEIKVAVTQLVKHFQFLPADNYKPEIIAEISLKSSNGICVKLIKREELMIMIRNEMHIIKKWKISEEDQPELLLIRFHLFFLSSLTSFIALFPQNEHANWTEKFKVVLEIFISLLHHFLISHNWSKFDRDMIAEIFVSLLLVLLCLLYTRSSRYRIGNFDQPPSKFLIGNALDVASSKKILPFLHEYAFKFNGLFKCFIGIDAFLVASNYEFIEWIMKSNKIISKPERFFVLEEWLGDGLLTSTGSHWREHRKIVSPAFHFKMIEDFIRVCNRKTDILLRKLDEKLDEDPCDLYDTLTNFTLSTIVESSMKISIDAEEAKSGFLEAIKIVAEISIERMINGFYTSNIGFLFHPKRKAFQKSLQIVRDFNRSVIKKRKDKLDRSEVLVDPNDNVYRRKKGTPFLDLLLTTVQGNGQPFSDKDIMDEVNTVVLAGYDSVSSAISFILYNIANNPNIQTQAFEEQTEFCSGEEITSSELSSMKYLDMVVKESLRLYTPIPFIARKVEEDVYYDGKLIPEGTTIIIVMYSLHRNPEWFPEPEKFNPERFDSNSKIPPFAYIPFSAGPRNCIGQKFAMAEVKIAVAKILRTYELLPARNFKPQLYSALTLRSENGVCVKLKRRNPSVTR